MAFPPPQGQPAPAGPPQAPPQPAPAGPAAAPQGPPAPGQGGGPYGVLDLGKVPEQLLEILDEMGALIDPNEGEEMGGPEMGAEMGPGGPDPAAGGGLPPELMAMLAQGGGPGGPPPGMQGPAGPQGPADPHVEAIRRALLGG
jgi:hypothetical protein